MALVLPLRFPALVRWALLAILVDLAVSLMVAGGDQGAGTLMLFQLGTFLGWMGGLEALAWVAQDSPWSRADSGPEEGVGGIQRKMSLLRRWDLAGWRTYLIRLTSGASLIFLVSTVFLFKFSHLLPARLIFLGWWSLLTFVRLIPVGCASTFVVPVSLFVLPHLRPSRGDLVHGGVAALSSLAALFMVWSVNQPPVGDFAMAVVRTGLDLWGWPYGFMLGGFFWYLVLRLRGHRSE